MIADPAAAEGSAATATARATRQNAVSSPHAARPITLGLLTCRRRPINHRGKTEASRRTGRDRRSPGKPHWPRERHTVLPRTPSRYSASVSTAAETPEPQVVTIGRARSTPAPPNALRKSSSDRIAPVEASNNSP